MNNNETITTLKQEILHLHKQIARAYSGDATINQNVIQLIHQLTYLSTEYKRLKSQAEQ